MSLLNFSDFSGFSGLQHASFDQTIRVAASSANRSKHQQGQQHDPSSRAECLATELHKAVGLVNKGSTLIEIVCSSTNQEIDEIKETYKKLYGNPLEDDINKCKTFKLFRSLLIALAQGQRDESGVVDAIQVKKDARRLLRPGATKLGSGFLDSLFATRSLAHLKRLMYEYEMLTGKSLEKAIGAGVRYSVEKAMIGKLLNTLMVRSLNLLNDFAMKK